MTPTTYGAIQPFSAFNFSEKIVTVKIYHGLDISVENTANDNGLMRLTTQLGQLFLGGSPVNAKLLKIRDLVVCYDEVLTIGSIFSHPKKPAGANAFIAGHAEPIPDYSRRDTVPNDPDMHTYPIEFYRI